MIRLRTLGILDLRDDDDRELASVVAQPKRLALLAYIALAPQGRRRRDTLLACFWPEADDTRARRSLNQALYTLRRALGAGVLVRKGDDDLEVDLARLAIDVADFEALLEAGDSAGALELYGGDFLDGFHLPDAPAFERWVEDERSRLRARATAAAQAAAVREEGTGNPVGALPWLRRALALAPFDEEILLELLHLLGRLGDRSGALREYAAFERRYAEELELEPGPQVRAAVERLRTSGPIFADSPTRPAPDHAALPTRRTPATAPPPPTRPAVLARGKRARALARLGFVLALLTAATVGTTLSPRTGDVADTPASGRARVAVLSFDLEGDESFAYLSDALVELLGQKLVVEGLLEAVDPHVVRSAARSEGAAGRISPARAARVARGLGAGLYVLGTAVETGGRLELGASLYGEDGIRRGDATARAVDRAGVLDAVDRIAADLLTAHFLRPGERPTAAVMAAVALPALRKYVAGQTELHAGRYHEAVAALQEAVTIDSAFTLARFRLAVAAEWAGRFDVMMPSLERAWAERDRLTEREQLLVLALRAIHGYEPYEVAERSYRRLVARDPTDVEAETNLVDMWFHNGRWGIRPSEVRDGLRRLLARDPSNGDLLMHLARLEASERQLGSLDRLVTRGLELGGEGLRTIELRALRAFALRDSAAMEASIDELRRLDGERLHRIVLRTILYTGELGHGRRLATLLTDVSRPPDLRALGHLLHAQIDAGQGRMADAWRRVDEAERAEPLVGLFARVILACYPSLPVSGDALAAARDAADRLIASRASEFVLWGIQDHLTYDMTALFRGLLAVRAGDREEALAVAEELEGVGRVDATERAALIRSFAAHAEGDPVAALRLIGDETRGRGSEPLGLEIMLRAELLDELGRAEDALRWYGVMLQEHPLSLPYFATSHARRADILLRLGRAAEAEVHRRRAAELTEHGTG